MTGHIGGDSDRNSAVHVIRHLVSPSNILHRDSIFTEYMSVNREQVLKTVETASPTRHVKRDRLRERPAFQIPCKLSSVLVFVLDIAVVLCRDFLKYVLGAVTRVEEGPKIFPGIVSMLFDWWRV